MQQGGVRSGALISVAAAPTDHVSEAPGDRPVGHAPSPRRASHLAASGDSDSGTAPGPPGAGSGRLVRGTPAVVEDHHVQWRAGRASRFPVTGPWLGPPGGRAP